MVLSSVADQADQGVTLSLEMNDINCRQPKDRLALVIQHKPPGGGGGGGESIMNTTAVDEAAVYTIATTSTSHVEDDDNDDVDAKPTQIDTVTLKCDLNDYLINLITVRCSLAQSKLAGVESAAGAQGATTNKYPSVCADRRTTVETEGEAKMLRADGHGIPSSSISSYIPFDELVRCTEREREWKRKMVHGGGRLGRLRLCGGGEDSINNGTSAWGTPPGSASNGALSAWGVLPNQSLPPPAWGNVGGNNNNNNNNGSSSSSGVSGNNNSGGNSTSNGAGSNNGTSGNGSSSNSTGSGGGTRGGSTSSVDPNFNKQNAQSQQQQQQQGTPQGGAATPPNAWNTAAANHRGAGQHQANVANNNGNHHQHHNHHNHNHSHHQQQQQQQQAAPPAVQNQQANNGGNNGNGNGAGNGNGTAKNQLEVLNTMREALFAQDGWGCQHVNQDTNWEVPGSPEPPGTAASSTAGGVGGGGAAAAGGASKADGGGGPNGGGGWKPQIMNNGTELWETNLRNGSAPNQQPQQPPKAAAPWVPANNLGGTWMEDDDNGSGGGAGGGPIVGGPSVGPDGANVWNGSAAAIVAGTVAPVGGSGWVAPAANSAGGAGMWPPGVAQNPVPMNNPQVAVKKELNEWGSLGGGAQQQQQPGTPGGIIGASPGAAGGVGVGTPGGGPGVSAAGLMTQGWGGDGRAGLSTPGLNLASSIGQSNALIGGGGELRGDPRGISGRLNGAGAVGGGMGWGAGPQDHIGGKLQSVGGGLLPSAAVSAGGGGGGPPGQPWGSTNNNSNNSNSGPNKLSASVGGGWDDSGRPLDDAAAGGMLWGQGNAVAGGVLARQNSSGGWKDVVPDPMMRGAGHLQRNQAQVPLQGGGGPFGPGVPSGANPAGSGVRFGGGGGGAALSLGKPDAMWGQGGNSGLARNGSWEDGVVPGWGDNDKVGSMAWNVDIAQSGGGGWNKTPTTPKSVGSGGWPDPNDLTSGGVTGGGMDWCLGGGAGKLPGANNKPLGVSPLEYIRASKEYRLLCEMGHKKEDVEFSLRATGMIVDDAMELLRHGAGVGGGGGWRRPLSDEHGGLGMGYDGPYAGRIPPLNHAASGLSFSQNNQNMLNNIPGGPAGLGLDGNGGPANLVALNNLKYLSQQQGSGAGAHPSFNHGSLLPPGGGGGRGPNQQSQQAHQQQLAAAAAAQPSNQQLRMLVQQIQMAVQNGFLNHQILNQPLAPQTLILLNQLLNHIKQMQLTQSNLARSGATGGVSAVQLTLAINKHKTQIAQLQQQIAAQQSIYLKQQQQQASGGGVPPGHQGPPPLMPSNPVLGMDFLRQQQQQQQQQQDLMALQGNFGEMALGKDPLMAASTGGVFPPPVVPPPQLGPGGGHLGAGPAAGNNVIVSGGSTSQQSRLNQWKLPSLEKDPSAGKDDLTDFSRAPGPTMTAAKSSTTSANLSSLGLVQDGTWATGRANLTDGWPEQAGETDSKDWTTTANNSSSQDSSAFTDLVPEFEPGKPWKGTQLKIEDDPSITPGSVARSPLSIATAKESELFGGVSAAEKVSPSAAGGNLNLTSSAWSFNTPPTTAVASGGKGGIISAGKPSVWTDGAAGPGIAVSSAAADVWCTPIGKPSATRGPPPGLGGTANKGGNGAGGGGVSWSTGSQRGSWGVGTSWLLLKNLTSQIDASTLRTLCMQHGPIVSFHSYPAHGLALCRYNTREEATTAQQALNNCPLGSGTISAECPASESEVQTYLQQLGSGGVSGPGEVTTVAGSSSATGSISSISAQSWRQRGSTNAGADTWGSGWPLGGSAGAGGGSSSAGTNLWAPLDSADQGTPSSLNSFLPESLLGPELN